jgi:Secretion system C-terminal sorting domain
MKKQYLFMLGLAMAGLTANAQTNMVTNGDFEDWTGANPDYFTEQTGSGTPPPIYNDNLTKETTNVMAGTGGLNSCRQTSVQDKTQFLEYSELINVDPTHSYTLSYWYLDNSDDASTRPWSTWLPNSGSIAANLQSLQQTAYSTDSPNWVFKTITATPPTAATKVRIQVRTYTPTTGGGYIYYDNLSFVDNTTAGVNDNAIIGLSLFPNPVNGDVLYVASSNDVSKSVTIFDILGKQVINTTVSNNGTIDVSALTAGVYMIKVTEEGKTATKKLVVQ